MNKQKLFILTMLSFIHLCLFSQSLMPTVVSSSGAYATSGVGSLSYTVGELAAVTTLSSGSSMLTQGFQQSDISFGVSILNLESNENGSMIIYPNPADNTFTVGYKFPNSGLVQINMYDETGKKITSVLTEKYINGNAVYNYNCSQVPAGNYMVGLEYTSSTGENKVLLEKKLIIVKQ